MSPGNDMEKVPTDPWQNVGQRFQIVAVLTLLLFGGFAIYDSREFHARYLKRCEESPNRPECTLLNSGKPKPRPDLGIVMDHESGRWALQLEATDEKTASENSARLWSAGANPRLIKIIGRSKVVLYYIQLGRFKTQKEAFGASSQLKAKGLPLNFVIAEYRQQSK